eukprot:COSAG06_NODE_472_length_15317_cov_10.547312_1_plen_65_part_00
MTYVAATRDVPAEVVVDEQVRLQAAPCVEAPCATTDSSLGESDPPLLIESKGQETLSVHACELL